MTPEQRAFEEAYQGDKSFNLIADKYRNVVTQWHWETWQAALDYANLKLCTETDQENCPRHCIEFCNKQETEKAIKQQGRDDGKMLYFLLENDARVIPVFLDCKFQGYQVITEDDNGNCPVLSGDSKYFPSKIDAINAAMKENP
jgi:hypothetical protein